MGIGVYKVWTMGLLPTSGSDFLAWKSERPVLSLLVLKTNLNRLWNGVLHNFTRRPYLVMYPL